KPYKLEGQDVRFLRKFLELTAEKFSRILSIDKAHMSRMENGAVPVSDQVDRLIRLIALSMAEGVDQKHERAVAAISEFAHIQPAKKGLTVLVTPGTTKYEYKAA